MDHRQESQLLHVVPILAQASDRWRLTDPYVEIVWAEYLGPTATLLARRFGRMIDGNPSGVDIDLRDLADGVGVQPGVARRALDRLNRFEVVYFSTEQSIVGVSGFAPSVSGHRLARLSTVGRAMHDQLTAEAALGPPAGAGVVSPLRSARRRASAACGLGL